MCRQINWTIRESFPRALYLRLEKEQTMCEGKERGC